MENNNQELLCCVKDLFGGCGSTPSSPSLRYMFASVLTKQDDGCFALKVNIPIPPAIDVDSLLCGGATETVSVKDEALTQVYLAGQSDAIPVCVVNDKDVASAQKCDVNTGNTILIRSVFDDDTNTWENPTYFDLITGTAWAGNPATDLTECDSNTLESDKIVLCDDNGEFYRWIVKDNGEPTGVSYDTTISGVLYTPVGAVVECSDPTITLLPVCDVLTAVIGGTIPYTFATPYNAAVDYSTVTVANDTVVLYWTDFGDGYSDVGPSPDHTYEADGHYEIKSYVVTASGNKLLIAAKEINVVAGVVTLTGPNPHAPNRTYKISVGSAMQEYSGATPVGAPINPDGSVYPIVGDFEWNCPIVIDELEDNAEYKPEANLVECEVVNGMVTEGTDANIQAAGAFVGVTPVVYHTQLGSTLNLLGTGGNLMGSGINIDVAQATTGYVINYTIEVVNDSDPTSPDDDFAITVLDNATGQPVLATSITGLVSNYDAAGGGGLAYPIFNSVSSGVTYNLVWTGDLPAGSYTAIFIGQDQSSVPGNEDNFNVQIGYPAVSTLKTLAQLTALDQCTIDALTQTSPPAIEIPNGAMITNGFSIPVGLNVQSFSVKPLLDSNGKNTTYDITFDSGATWLIGIDGTDSWGEGNSNLIDTSQVIIRPNTVGNRVLVIWEQV